jgi:hypothetical protein
MKTLCHIYSYCLDGGLKWTPPEKKSEALQLEPACLDNESKDEKTFRSGKRIKIT